MVFFKWTPSERGIWTQRQTESQVTEGNALHSQLCIRAAPEPERWTQGNEGGAAPGAARPLAGGGVGVGSMRACVCVCNLETSPQVWLRRQTAQEWIFLQGCIYIFSSGYRSIMSWGNLQTAPAALKILFADGALVNRDSSAQFFLRQTS